jgi:uncharacterized protein YdbL (DUF1318 family)
MKRVSFLSAVLLCLILIMACITVNIYFPAGAIQEAADQIVDEVRPEQQEKKGSSLDRMHPRWLAWSASVLGPLLAFAQVDIEISTPSIRALRGSLADRFKSLEGFYRRGALGENNQGYVEIRDQSGLNLKEKANLRRLVDAENRDRRALYMEILEANNLDRQFLDEVERLFANSWRGKKVVPGTWIQRDDGTWVRK